MELLIQFVAVPVIGVIPFLICLLVCWFCSSWRRWIAAALVLMSGSIFLFEVYNASVGGNLTGLIWILSLPIVFIAAGVLYLMEKLAKRLQKPESSVPVPSGDGVVENSLANTKNSIKDI